MFGIVAAILTAVSVCQPPPPAEDVYRFPPSAVVDGWYTFRQAYLEHLWRRWHTEPWHRPALLEVISETESLWQPWDTLRDAQHAYDPRPYLGSLRRMLGEDAYARASMPPPVPYWRFRPID